MNIVLWILQSLLALAFLAHGLIMIVSAGVGRRADERDAAALAAAVHRHVGSAGRRRPDAARHHAHPAVAGLRGVGRS